MPKYAVFDRVCTYHGDCGYVQHVYIRSFERDWRQRYLVAFDDPSSGPDTWLETDLLPEDEDESSATGAATS